MFATGTASAQEVAVTALEGDLTLTGTLLSYDGRFYRLETIYGVLTLDGSKLTCAGDACPNTDDYVPEIRLSGADHMAEGLMPDLIAAFAHSKGATVSTLRIDEANTRIGLFTDDRETMRFTLHAATSDEGFADLIADVADIAMVLRAPLPFERTLGQQSEAGDLTTGHRTHVVGMDAVAVVTSPDLPKAFDLDQLAEIFTGLGRPVAIHIPRLDSGVFEAFEMLVGRSERTRNYQIHLDPDKIADTVATQTGAIGVTSLSRAGDLVPVALIDGCGFGVAPEPFAVQSGDYPLSLPLILHTPARQISAAAQEFLAFATSSAMAPVLREGGFVPISALRDGLGLARLNRAVVSASDETTVPELQQMLDALDGRERAAFTFRLQEGTEKLDAQSDEALGHLSKRLDNASLGSESLIFAGFTDSTGSAAANRDLSLRRRTAVMAQMEKTSSRIFCGKTTCCERRK